MKVKRREFINLSALAAGGVVAGDQFLHFQ